MAYLLDLSEQAQKDIVFHKTSGNKGILKKLSVLLNELTQHPFEGTGKPEQLKHNLAGYFSRRINQEHRLVYRIDNGVVKIVSAKGHYV